MTKEVEESSSVECKRMTWNALRDSINQLVNNVNPTNIKDIIIPHLFLLGKNLIRGRGLFCQSVMTFQTASPESTDVFAALVAVVNTRFPDVGYLLAKRIVWQFQEANKKNDKAQLLAAVKFIAHLINQEVIHELIALEILTTLLEINPNDDNTEVAVGFITECGSVLEDVYPRDLDAFFECLRGRFHEVDMDKQVELLHLFVIRAEKFLGCQAIRPELDLADDEDQVTHEISLLHDIDPESALDIFNPEFLENGRRYEELKKAIFCEMSEDEA